MLLCSCCCLYFYSCFVRFVRYTACEKLRCAPVAAKDTDSLALPPSWTPHYTLTCFVLLLLLLLLFPVPSCRDLYADAGAEAAAGDVEEPELRRQLRAARAAEKHAKMKAALAEQQAKEAAETERRQQQQAHKQAHQQRIEAWRNKNKVGVGAAGWIADMHAHAAGPGAGAEHCNCVSNWAAVWLAGSC